MRRRAPQAGPQSTAAVLWLMILIVFLPIALAHGIARLTDPSDGSVASATESSPSGG